MHLFYIAFTAFDVFATVLTLGVLACGLWVVPHEAAEAFHQTLWRMLGVSFALLTLSSVLILLSRSLEMSGGPVSALPGVAPMVLSGTHYGRVWWVRPPVLLLLWIAWIAGRRYRNVNALGWVMFAAAAIIAFTRSETGHPADHGDFTFAVWIDWLHLMGAGLWIGSLFAMTLVVFPRLRRHHPQHPLLAADIFQRLSTLAGLALALILVTGIYTAWRQLDTWSAFVTTAYGRTLLVKLSLVAVLILIGAHNRYLKLPRLQQAAGRVRAVPRWLSWSLRKPTALATADPVTTAQRLRACTHAVKAESLLGVGVLAAASVLLHGMPPAAMSAIPAFGGTMSMGDASSSMSMPAPGATPPAASASAMSAFGAPGKAREVRATLHINALDSMRFEPAEVHVEPGETVRFVVTNRGKLLHEFVIGDAREQREHELEMEKMPDAPMHDPNGISLRPGETRSIIWTFPDRSMQVEYACHQPGHFAAGMLGLILVDQAPGKTAHGQSANQHAITKTGGG